MKNISKAIFDEVSSSNRNSYRKVKKIMIEEASYEDIEEVIDEVPYDGTSEKFCPRCGRTYTQYPAISRYDDKTYICPDCGVEEAMINYTKGKLQDPHVYTKENMNEEVTIDNPSNEEIEKDEANIQASKRKETEDRIGELKQALSDGDIADDEREAMEKEISELESVLESAEILTEAPEDEEFELSDEEPTEEEIPVDEPMDDGFPIEDEMTDIEYEDEVEEDKEDTIDDAIEEPFYATTPEFDELRDVLVDLDYRLFLINDNMACIGRLNGPDIEFLTSNRPEADLDIEKSEQNDNAEEVEERAEENGEDAYEYIWIKAPDTFDKFLNQVNVVYLSPEMSDEDKEQYAGIEASHDSVMNYLMNELPEDKKKEHEDEELEDTLDEEPVEDIPMEEPVDEEIPEDIEEHTEEETSVEDEEEE